MIKPILQDTVFFRVPRFSYQQNLKDNWIILKQLIKEASPEFYKVVEHLTAEELDEAESKVQQTIRKYYNRAAFRSTPYSAFAGVGVGKMDWKPTSRPLLTEDIISHAYPDWRNRPQLFFNPSDLRTQPDLQIFSNSTYYQVQREIRYIRKEDDGFRMAAIDSDPVILQLLDFCRRPTTLTALQAYLKIEADDLQQTLCDLIDVQLLLTSLHPNIIGTDYFCRVDVPIDDDKGRYLIAERKIQHGTFDKSLFRHLPELVAKMQYLAAVKDSQELTRFKSRFLQKYEQNEVPLLEALDPEIGIGYGHFTTPPENSPLTRLATARSTTMESAVNPLRNILYREIIQSQDTGQPIDLDSLITEKESEGLLPNSMAALCSVIDDNLFLHSLGGVSATIIPARFALALPDLEAHCREIAELEERANPDVLFFDIGYTCEPRIDNINRRPSFYGYQLNILNYDTSADPLGVNDILVSVQGGQVMLKSRSRNKRLMPRMASAYNYVRSDLALLHFLVDIQSQGLLAGLSLRLSDFIPELPYYPRIQFKNIIVAPATWFLSLAIIKETVSITDKCERLRSHLRAKGQSKFIKAGRGDQTLCLDIDTAKEMELLVALLEKHKKLYVEETALPVVPAICDAAGKPMLNEVLLTLTHEQQMIMPLQNPSPKQSGTRQKCWVAPGNDWLYFEIFLHPQRADEVLKGRIRPYLKANGKKISSWFFIRYNDGGDHIRLRMKLKRREEGYALIRALSAALGDELKSGIVSDIRLRTYKKETQRYSEKLMDQVEAHFCIDSKLVLAGIKAALQDTAKYLSSLTILDAIVVSGLFDPDRLLHIAQKVAAALSVEHGIKTEGYKELNQLYKNKLRASGPPFAKHYTLLLKRFITSLENVLRRCDEFQRPQMFIDLMHMHINRLFTADQRLHELAVYNAFILKRKSEINRMSATDIRA